MKWQRPWLGLAVGIFGVFGAVTCDRRDSRADAVCPPCECVCNQSAGAASPVAAGAASPVAAPPQAQDGGPLVTASPANDAGAVAELVADASRKMMHGDGAGCLADLDRVAALDARQDARLAATRGQCEMLTGACQAGKARVAAWYVADMAMTPERAGTTAESIAAMRCRGGDSTDRDRLLRALHELSDAAYMNKRPSAVCSEHLAIARKLIPLVKAGPDDGQISGGAQALFHTAASCFAHAGDCKSAWTTWRELFPAAGLGALPDPAERDKVVGAAFDSAVSRCTGKRG